MLIESIQVEGLFTDGTTVYNVYATHAGEEYQQLIFAATEHHAAAGMWHYIHDMLDSQTNTREEEN